MVNDDLTIFLMTKAWKMEKHPLLLLVFKSH